MLQWRLNTLTLNACLLRCLPNNVASCYAIMWSHLTTNPAHNESWIPHVCDFPALMRLLLRDNYHGCRFEAISMQTSIPSVSAESNVLPEMWDNTRPTSVGFPTRAASFGVTLFFHLLESPTQIVDHLVRQCTRSLGSAVRSYWIARHAIFSAHIVRPLPKFLIVFTVQDLIAV